MDIIKLIDQDLDESTARETAIMINNWVVGICGNPDVTSWRIDTNKDTGKKLLMVFSDDSLVYGLKNEVLTDIIMVISGVDEIVVLPYNRITDDATKKISNMVKEYENRVNAGRTNLKKIRFFYAPKDNAIILLSTEPYILSMDSELLNGLCHRLSQIEKASIDTVVLAEVSDCLSISEVCYGIFSGEYHVATS